MSIRRFDEVECSTAEDVIRLAQLLEKCNKFKVAFQTLKKESKYYCVKISPNEKKVIQLHLTLEDEMTEGWRALSDQLTRFKQIQSEPGLDFIYIIFVIHPLEAEHLKSMSTQPVTYI